MIPFLSLVDDKQETNVFDLKQLLKPEHLPDDLNRCLLKLDRRKFLARNSPPDTIMPTLNDLDRGLTAYVNHRDRTRSCAILRQAIIDGDIGKIMKFVDKCSWRNKLEQALFLTSDFEVLWSILQQGLPTSAAQTWKVALAAMQRVERGKATTGLLDFLQKQGIDFVRARDARGKSLLDYVVFRSSVPMVRWMLENGAVVSKEMLRRFLDRFGDIPEGKLSFERDLKILNLLAAHVR